MKKYVLLFFLATPVGAVAPVITPSNPVVNQGGTIQFSETLSEAGTWSCSATTSTGGATACLGSINGSGLYTAPSSVTAQHVYGGMQVGPNSSVYNVRIDSVPIHPNNTLYMNTVNQGGSPNWATDFPINYVLPTGTSDTMNFLYTPSHNGSFEVPSFPNAKAENGWFAALQHLDGADHHVIMVDTVTGNFSEFYQYLPTCVTTAASVTNNIATLTCSVNPQSTEFMVGSTVAVGGFTGADTYFNVATASITAVTPTSISYPLVHANGTASTNGSASKSQANATGLLNSASGIIYSSMNYLVPTEAATDAAGMKLQPLILTVQEFERAAAIGGDINHAFRNTFGIGFEASASTWPATTFATDGSTVPFGTRLRLKSSVNISTYSANAQILLRALQHYGTFNVDGGNNWPMNAEASRWPKTYFDALTEVSNATISGNMEFVDESGIMLSTASELTKNNRELVKFTRTSDSSTTVQDVLFMGPAVNFKNDVMYFMAGTPAQQLPVLNNYGGFTCSMAPSTGTLTSGCLYTPPSTVSVATTTIIYATSTVNSNANAQMTLTVFPSTGIYVIPSKTADYTDTKGNTWTSRSGLSNFPDTQGCCACDNSASFPAITDVALWNCAITNAFKSADLHMDFVVPNGTYQTIYHYGTLQASGGQFVKLSVGNNEVYYNVDISSVAGGQFQPFTSTTTAVTNNLLQVGIWQMNAQGAPVSSLSVIPIASAAPPSTVSQTQTGGMTCKGGFLFK